MGSKVATTPRWASAWIPRIQVLQVIHREGAEVGGQRAAAQIGELIHVPFHRQTILIRRQIDLLGLGQREADVFTEDVHRIGQARLGGGRMISWQMVSTQESGSSRYSGGTA